MNFDRFWTGKHNLRFHLLKTSQNLDNLYVKQFKLVHLDGICNNVFVANFRHPQKLFFALNYIPSYYISLVKYTVHLFSETNRSFYR